MYIPLLEKEDVASTSTQEDEVAEGYGETILLVDDQSHIVETGKEVLESLGYRVLTATDGWQAVEKNERAKAHRKTQKLAGLV